MTIRGNPAKRARALAWVLFALAPSSLWGQSYDEVSVQMKTWGPGTPVYGRNQARVEAGGEDVHALIWPTDRNPVDVVLRRTDALLRDIAKIGGAPDLRGFESELAALKSAADAKHAGDRELFDKLTALRQRIALANPLIDFDEVIASAYSGEPIIQGHNCASTMAKERGDRGLYRVSNIKSGKPEVRDLLEDAVVAEGRYKGWCLSNKKPRDASFKYGFQSFDLSFDGKKIVFAWFAGKDLAHIQPENLLPEERAYFDLWRKAQGWKEEQAPQAWDAFAKPPWGYGHNGSYRTYDTTLHLFTMNLDGTDLRQVTDSHLYNDYFPIWLPNGHIAFVSDRIHAIERCGGDREGGSLHSVAADGSDLRALSWHETNELYPSVTNDGRIVYTRWDYIDRTFWRVHNLWICGPDGQDPRAPHANYNGEHPISELGIRAIPGTTSKFFAIASGHHSPPFGNPIIIDLAIPDMAQGNWRFFWPGLEPIGDGLDVRYPVRRDFREPYPLSEKYAIVGTAAGLALIDVFGNEVPLCGGPGTRCVQPVRPRPRPPIIPHAPAARATVGLVNVYDSDFLWPAGTRIKELRIVRVFSKNWPYTGHIHSPPIGWSSGAIARMVLGTVPVEEDGSAYFIAPTECEIYFQALNEQGLAVQTMRSGTYVHPGESLTCAGCHEDKWRAPVGKTARSPLAFRRGPSKIKPEVGGVEPVNYYRLAKPVLQAKCLPCHKEEGKGINFEYWKGEDAGVRLPRDVGYETKQWAGELRKFVRYYDASYDREGIKHQRGCTDDANPAVQVRDPGRDQYRSYPGKQGAMASPLLQFLGSGHYDVKLTPEEFRRITLWLDCNAVALGSNNSDPELVDRQMRGELVWPETVDPGNPLGATLSQDKAEYRPTTKRTNQ